MKFRSQIPMLDFTGNDSNHGLNQYLDELLNKTMIFIRNFFHLSKMSSYNNHWSSAKESNNQINKLDEKHTYQIVDVQKQQTSFGKKYVLIDDSNNRYWTNNKVDEFIKEHKDIKKFQLITSEFKSFKNKKGEEIKYLSIDINF